MTVKKYKKKWCLRSYWKRVNWKNPNSQAPTTFHCYDIFSFSPFLTLLLSQISAAWSLQTCSLMVMEPGHGEGPGKNFNTVAQGCDASHRLRVLQKEVLEVLELSWRRQQEKGSALYFELPVLSPLNILSPLIQQVNITYTIFYLVKKTKKKKKTQHMFLASTELCITLLPFSQ